MGNYTKRRLFNDNDDGASSGGTGLGPVYNDLDPVISQINTPPAHVSGERYLINTAPTGAWVGHENEVAESNGAAWTYTVATLYDYVYITSTLVTMQFNGSIWIPAPARAILQNGNTFGGSGVRIGTNDSQPVWIKYGGTNKFRMDSSDIRTTGSIYLGIPLLASAASARLHVRSAGATSATNAVKVDDSATTELFHVRSDGHTKITSSIESEGSGNPIFEIQSSSGGSMLRFHAQATYANLISFYTNGVEKTRIQVTSSADMYIQSTHFRVSDLSNNKRFDISSAGDTMIGDPANATSANARLHVVGSTSTSAAYAFMVEDSGFNDLLAIRNDGRISMPLVQTGNAGLSAGDLYQDTAANVLANGDNVLAIKV